MTRPNKRLDSRGRKYNIGTWWDTFIEHMQVMGVSGSGTHEVARSIASDCAR